MYLFSEFVRLAVKKIFTLYKEAEFKPSTVVLVGHSMVNTDIIHQTVNSFYNKIGYNKLTVIASKFPCSSLFLHNITWGMLVHSLRI